MLILGLVVALARISRTPALFPVRLLVGGLRRRAARRPDDPRRLPDRLRRPGADALGPPDRPGRARRHRAHARLLGLRRRGLPGGDRVRAPEPARRRARGRADRGPGDAPRRAAAGGPQRRAAAAQRLHLAAEGRRADLDPRPARGVPGRADRGVLELRLHPARGGRAALPVRDGPARADPRPLGAQAAAMTTVLEVRGVTKAYGERPVLRGIDLAVARARRDRADRGVRARASRRCCAASTCSRRSTTATCCSTAR